MVEIYFPEDAEAESRRALRAIPGLRLSLLACMGGRWE